MAGRRLDGVDVDADSAARVRLRIDPADASRTRICGRMADVCDALDALIAREAARDATPALSPALSPVLSAALSAASPGA